MAKVTVNGKLVPISEEELEIPLIWFLRDSLNLKGTKFGCGKGLCGACTVHLGKAPIRSCQTPTNQVIGKRVTTIEGLAHTTKGQLHPLQEAWIKHNVPQCGYCQPGQIMGAAALLQSNPKANDQEITAHMSGHICRCGTYPRIKKAIKEAIKG